MLNDAQKTSELLDSEVVDDSSLCDIAQVTSSENAAFYLADMMHFYETYEERNVDSSNCLAILSSLAKKRPNLFLTKRKIFIGQESPLSILKYSHEDRRKKDDISGYEIALKHLPDEVKNIRLD